MKAIGETLFLGARKTSNPSPREGFRRISAREAELRESWFRDAIFQNPEIVIGPCRSAGRVGADEVWLPWKIEHNFGSGPVDVLLLSSEGRVGIVETKLSYNPQRRREVVAQILDYALSLQVDDFDDVDWPALPADDAAPDEGDLRECIEAGRFLLIVAGDALDPRALRLSQAVLGRAMTSEWDLALVDLNLFESADHPEDLLIVPELLGTVTAEVRNVVKIAVSADRARVEVEHKASDSRTVSRSPRLKSVEEFLQMVEGTASGQVAAAVVGKFQEIAEAWPDAFGWELKSATANLYWLPPDGGQRRIFSLSRRSVFRTWVGYLEKRGYDDEARRVRYAVAGLGSIGQDQQSLRTFPESTNVELHLAAIDSVVRTLTGDAAVASR